MNYLAVKCHPVVSVVMLASCLFGVSLAQADTLALKAVTPVPFEKNHSFVLLDEASQCRYIGKVQPAGATASAAPWVMKVEEKWCRPNAYRPERAADFHGAILELKKPLVPGDQVSLVLTAAS